MIIFIYILIPGSLVALYLFPWLLFAIAPVLTSVHSAVILGLSVGALAVWLIYFMHALHNPIRWLKRSDFAYSLLLVTLSIANIVGAFSTIYLQADHSQVGCFSNIGVDGINHSLSHVDAVYFTLTTLTTVGYGDIHAASGSCRGWVSAQLFVTLIVIGLGIATLATRVFPALKPGDGSTDKPGAEANGETSRSG